MLPRTFSYTARRGTFGGSVSMFIGALLLESSIIALLIAVLVRNPPLRAALLILLAMVLAGLIGGFLLAPLWTKHRLTATHLHLRYGWDQLVVPRAAIRAAEPVHERLSTLQLIRAQHDPRAGRIVLALSEHGQIRLRLDQPYRWRVNGATHAADQIVFNVDDRDGLLAALAVPPHAAPQDHNIDAPLTSTPTRAPLDGSAVGPPRTASVAIEADALTRRYGNMVAVDRLNLAVAQGGVYGFLGPNGAGKTTTIRMLVGLLEPSAGHARIAGHDVWREPLAAKGALGYVPDRALLYERLSGREFLHFLAQLRGMPLLDARQRIDALLDLLDLLPHADRLCGTYSFGMGRKLALAGALLHQPSVLILDEPLNGLDPLSARRLKDVFAELAAHGTTILLSTHDLATAEAVCDRVGILQRGRLIAEGRPHELRDLLAAPDLEQVFLRLTAEQTEAAA